MEYQFIDEVTQFCDILMLPFILSIATLIFQSWVIGKKSRNKITSKILKYTDKQDNPEEHNVVSALKSFVDYSAIKSSLAVFFILVLVFGFDVILRNLFLSSFSCSIPGIYNICGISNDNLAIIWSANPNINDYLQLCEYISDNSTSINSLSFIYSCEAYVKFNFILWVVVLIYDIRSKNIKDKKRIKKMFFSLIIITLVFIACFSSFMMLTCNEYETRCFEVLNNLKVRSIDSETLNAYISKVEEGKKIYNCPAFGLEIRSRIINFIKIFIQNYKYLF